MDYMHAIDMYCLQGVVFTLYIIVIEIYKEINITLVKVLLIWVCGYTLELIYSYL